MSDQPTTDPVRARAVDAAKAALDRALGLSSPPRIYVEEALNAAGEVYDQAADAEVDRVMEQTGFAGLNLTGDGVQLHLKYAHDVAAAMVSAFDALLTTRGATNYVEWESTVTDPARLAALDAGMDPEQWPPHRQYRVIVVKPDGKSPHELRQEADAKADRYRNALAALIAADDSGNWTDLQTAWELARQTVNGATPSAPEARR